MLRRGRDFAAQRRRRRRAGARVARLEQALGRVRHGDRASGLPFGDTQTRSTCEVGSIDALRGIALRRRRGAGARPGPRRTHRRGLRRHSATRADARRALPPGRRARRSACEDCSENEHPGVDVAYRRRLPLALVRLGGHRHRPRGLRRPGRPPAARAPRRAQRARSRPIQDFLELVEGGPVVHLHHGIGMYRGLAELDGPGRSPASSSRSSSPKARSCTCRSRASISSSATSAPAADPALSKLGGTEWTQRKKKVSDAVEELAERPARPPRRRAQRRRGPPLPAGHASGSASSRRAFPHPDTPDQATAVRAIKDDLEGDRPMDRLLCGDVGLRQDRGRAARAVQGDRGGPTGRRARADQGAGRAARARLHPAPRALSA